ncbi:hypothetical protein ACI6QG_15375 [Roseococcus sp. DSY-14]|uniref:hypothetical protein n=1 Tax=Roseococcus sp. DSY-14 TaxID=3369650 RepID=UPI00387B4339
MKAPSLALLPVLLLAACAPQRMEDRLVACPQLSLPADVADLTRHLPGAAPDLSTLVLDARVSAVDGDCRRGRRDQSVEVAVGLRLRVDRGPAATGRGAQIPWFIAVLDGEEILSRQSFVLPVAFAPNTTRAEVATPRVDISFPARPGRRIQDLRIITGLQPSPGELELNRRRGPR